jgi:hypothetical protein
VLTRHAAAVCVLSSLASGCLFEESPSARAAGIERVQCSDPKGRVEDLRILREARVLYVEAEYSVHLASGIGKVTGTRIVMRPPETVTSEKMTRVLQCHGARAYLRRDEPSPLAHDPFFLPDAWVSIDVASEGGNYVALLSSDTVYNNLRILRRANEFAADQRGAPRSERP